MNYARAMSRAKDGARVRRECWETPVVATESGMHFVLSASLSKSLGTNYSPTKTDKAATDWQVQP